MNYLQFNKKKYSTFIIWKTVSMLLHSNRINTEKLQNNVHFREHGIYPLFRCVFFSEVKTYKYACIGVSETVHYSGELSTEIIMYIIFTIRKLPHDQVENLPYENLRRLLKLFVNKKTGGELRKVAIHQATGYLFSFLMWYIFH